MAPKPRCTALQGWLESFLPGRKGLDWEPVQDYGISLSPPGKNNQLEPHNTAQVVLDTGSYSSTAAYSSLESGRKGWCLSKHSMSNTLPTSSCTTLTTTPQQTPLNSSSSREPNTSLCHNPTRWYTTAGPVFLITCGSWDLEESGT